MCTFIKLLRRDSAVELVNADLVRSIARDPKRGTVLWFAGEEVLYVQDSPDGIVELIQDAERRKQSEFG
jgi:urease gamma subunit